MKKHILFNQKMVKAILSGGKTQTRRNIKLPSDWDGKLIYDNSPFGIKYGAKDGTIKRLFPRIESGQGLWVKEAFFALGKWEKNGTTKTGKQKWRFKDLTSSMNRNYLYQTNSEKPAYISNEKDGFIHWYKRNSLFMPLKAARIYLKVEEVRAEKLMDISEQDILKEGIILPNYAEEAVKDVHYPDPWEIYFGLWEEINGIGTVEKNPFVWVISFSLMYNKE
jgi:hypothetical protein